ncbi:17592_t:CDS:2 [Gigaspora margarita]|uniref:17592_t:CDS:1 n=1 Tax=Gigaspora margarita TaxID=4874 RepID=A0ABN7UMY1_GIGMA|nr:17592_t:CDS:2 [Gigaspora margarita]
MSNITLMQDKEKSSLKKRYLKADSDLVEKNIISKKTIKLQNQKSTSYSYTLIQTDRKLAKKIVRRTPNSIAES